MKRGQKRGKIKKVKRLKLQSYEKINKGGMEGKWEKVRKVFKGEHKKGKET